jgi:dUTP pyrophosphatase
MSEFENDDLLDAELRKLLEQIENLTFDPEGMLEDDLETQEMNKDLSELDNMMNEELLKVEVSYKKLTPEAISPQYAYTSDSGFDLFSVEEIGLLPFERVLVPTGLSFDIPDGCEIQIRTKSGLAINQGLMVLNSPGTVDKGYTGEIKVIIMNMNNFAVTIQKGQKVGQAVLCPVFNGNKVKFTEKDDIGASERGAKGFGSTGIQN